MDSELMDLGEEPPLERKKDGGVFDQQQLWNAHLAVYTHSDPVMREIHALQRVMASNYRHEKRGKDCDIKDFPDLPSECELSGADDSLVSRLTPDQCLRRLRNIVQGPDGCIQKDCLLSPIDRRSLDVLMSHLKAFKLQQFSKWSETVSLLTQEYLPIEVVWQLHSNNVVSLQSFLNSAVKDRKQSLHLTEQLIQLCVTPRCKPLGQKILSGVCCQLVQHGFPEKKSENIAFRKVCTGLLDGVTRGLLDGHMNDAELLLHTDLWQQTGVDLSPICFKKFCTHTVSLIVSHNPNMKVSDALKRQTQWNSGKIPHNFKTLYKQLLVAFDSAEVVEMLHRILERQEVHWQTLLSFLATFLVCFPSAASHIQDHVSQLLHESLECGDMENTIVAFLLARQGCREGAHVFPPYPQWFQVTFSDSSKSPAGSKKSFSFLIKFLTELVPYEPSDVLKVHILRPPHVPAKCRDLWTDYTMLAKTRLADLKVPLEEANASIYADLKSSSTPAGAGMQDVDKAVAQFESSGKLPTTVMEASIFRKPYFVGKFLPGLLQPRHLPDIPDSRMKFIEALKKAGKIPASLFMKYEEACHKETRLLLEGVFEADEEEGVDEMMLSPVEQLTYRLKQLTDSLVSPSAHTTVSEVVSILSDKIEAVVGLSSESDTDSVCVIDICHPALPLEQVRVVDEVLNCVCRTVHTVHESNHASKHSWLCQLVRMIVSHHFTLLPAFITRLLALFTCRKSGRLSHHHVEGLAAFMLHLVGSATLLPPLVVRTHNWQDSQHAALLPLFLRCLPVCSESDMLEALRFVAQYLQLAFLGLDSRQGESSDLDTVLPPEMIVMACLLSWHMFPCTRPGEQEQSEPPLLPPPPPQHQVWHPHHTVSQYGTICSEGDLEQVECVLETLFASHKFQDLVRARGPSLQDWLNFELGVDPTTDCLSVLERQTYHHVMLSHFSRTAHIAYPSATDCSSGPGLHNTCKVMMEVLVRALSRSQTGMGRCSACQQALPVNPITARHNTPVNPYAADQLLMLLMKLLMTAGEDHSTKEGKEVDGGPMVARHLLQLLQSPEDGATGAAVVPQAVLRVAVSCPPHLLFTGSTGQGPTAKSMHFTVELMEKLLINCASEYAVVSLDVMSHLLQGYMAIAKDCRDKSVLQVFENHPLIVLSTLVHWQGLCSLVPLLPGCDAWGKLPGCLHMWDRFCAEGQVPLQLADKEPFCLAASLYASLSRRSCKPEMRKDLFQYLHQQEPKALRCLSVVLISSLSHPSITCVPLPPKIANHLQWLSELWGLFPELISSSLNSDSELSSLGRSLMSPELEPFTNLACLRCVVGLEMNNTVNAKGVVSFVVRLYAWLNRRFIDSSSKQDIGVQWILSLHQAVLDMIRAAPLSELYGVSQDDAVQCGVEPGCVLRQRLKHRQ